MAESPPGKGVALVTGASSGIGEQFARQLAARGQKLILVARRTDRLEKLAAELPTKAHVIGADLASEASELGARVAELDLEVELLVNNAGFGTHGRFLDQDAAREAEEIRLNCEAVVTLTHTFLPAMVERGSGGVITVASTAGMQPLPYEAVYSATKAFALNFSDALHMELRGTGVRILAVNPGPVPTEWQEVAGGDPTSIVPGKIEADQVVRESLAAYDRGARSVIPGSVIRWFVRAGALSPRALNLRVTERMYRSLKR
jgi:short-subunit dehydrogenase